MVLGLARLIHDEAGVRRKPLEGLTAAAREEGRRESKPLWGGPAPRIHREVGGHAGHCPPGGVTVTLRLL